MKVGKKLSRIYKPQHISQQEGGRKGQKEESCLLATAKAPLSLRSEAPCSSRSKDNILQDGTTT